MTKELELLSKMDLTEENRAKLQALLEESKKTGKVASKKLVETLDAVDATEEQTEKFYDVLEAAGVEIDVSDVLDLIGTAELDNPTLGEMQAIEDEGIVGGKPSSRRVDCQALCGQGHAAVRPHSGGQSGAHEGGREIRLYQGLQILNLRHLVDSPVHHARDCRSGADHPHPGTYGRDDQPRAADIAFHGAEARP